MATRVLIPQPILPAGYEYLRKHGYEAVDGRGFTEEDIITDIRDCDALIVRTARITRQIFDAAPKLKILARHGAGYDGVDLAAAREHGVLVCTAGGANAISVAELTIFYMLYCSRNFKKVQKYQTADCFWETQVRLSSLWGGFCTVQRSLITYTYFERFVLQIKIDRDASAVLIQIIFDGIFCGNSKLWMIAVCVGKMSPTITGRIPLNQIILGYMVQFLIIQFDAGVFLIIKNHHGIYHTIFDFLRWRIRPCGHLVCNGHL